MKFCMLFKDYWLFCEVFDSATINTDYEEVLEPNGKILLKYDPGREIGLIPLSDGGYEFEFDSEKSNAKGLSNDDPLHKVIPDVLGKIFGYLYAHKLSPPYLKFNTLRDISKDGVTSSEHIYKSLVSSIDGIRRDYEGIDAMLGSVYKKLVSKRDLLISDLEMLERIGVLGSRDYNDNRFNVLINASDMSRWIDSSRRGRQYINVLQRFFQKQIKMISIHNNDYNVILNPLH